MQVESELTKLIVFLWRMLTWKVQWVKEDESRMENEIWGECVLGKRTIQSKPR